MLYQRAHAFPILMPDTVLSSKQVAAMCSALLIESIHFPTSLPASPINVFKTLNYFYKIKYDYSEKNVNMVKIKTTEWEHIQERNKSPCHTHTPAHK